MIDNSPTIRGPRPLHLAAAAALVAAIAMWSPAHAAVVIRGPYLQVATSIGITVRWRTDVATNGRVRYGLSPTALTLSADQTTSGTGHTVALTGLLPDTRYYYSVGTTTQTIAGGTSAYTFKTAPVPGVSQPTRIWVIGDSGEPGADQQDVKSAFLGWTGSRDPDVWLMLGDNAYGTGTDSEYQTAVFSAYSEVLRKVPVWPTRGNHDELHSGSDYYGIFTMPTLGQAGGVPSGTEAYYSFDHGNIHFVCLDSEGSSRSSTGAMANWLRSDLAATTREWIIAYWHHPPYTKGSHDSDSDSQLEDMRQVFVPILEDAGVDLVLTGHSHSYERSYLLDRHYGRSSTLTAGMKKDAGDGRTSTGGDGAYQKPAGLQPHEGAVYSVVGSSAKLSSGSLNHPAMVVSLYRLGSLVIDVDGRQLSAKFLDENGTVRDDFTILKQALVGLPDGRKPPRPDSARVWLRTRPNPMAQGGASFEYSTPGGGRVTLSVYGADGRRVAHLVDQTEAGERGTVQWNGRDTRGENLPAGVYFAALEWGGNTRVSRIVKLR